MSVFCIDCAYCHMDKSLERSEIYDFDYECHKFPEKAKKISFVDKKEYVEWPECYMVNDKGECEDFVAE